MAQAVLHNVLRQLHEVAPQQLERVSAEVEAIRAAPGSDARAAAEAELLRAGLILEPLKSAGGTPRVPVPFTGGPVTETIIRERR